MTAKKYKQFSLDLIL